MCQSAGRWIEHLGTTSWLLARWVASCEAPAQLTLTGRIAANVLGASMARIMTLPDGSQASREQRRDSNLHFTNHKTNVHGNNDDDDEKRESPGTLQRSIPAVRPVCATYICFVAFCVSQHHTGRAAGVLNLATHQPATERHLPASQSVRHVA